MGVTEKLRLVVEADAKGAVQSIDNVGKAAEQSGKKVKASQSSLDKWGRGLQRTGAGLVGFGAVALAGLGGLAKMSEEANLSALKLQNTLQNSPKLAGENAKSFTDLATKIQSVTAADADQIVEAEAMLGTFALTGKQIRSITPLVVDYSRKFGVGLVDAATQVGKALDGQSGALKRNGVSIDETLFKTDRYRAVQEALSKQVGGFSRAEGATFEGSLARMKNELSDLGESVGGGAVDAFTDMFSVVGKAAGALDKVSPGAQHAAGKVAAFGAAGLVAVGGLSTLIGTLITARQRFAELGAGVSSMSSKLGGLGTIGPLGALAAALTLGVSEARHLNAEANKLNVDKAVSQLLSLSESGRKASREMVSTSLAFNHGERDVRQMAESSVPAARNFVKMAKALGAPEPLIRKLNKAIEDQKQADIGAAQAQHKYSDEVDNASGALDKNADSTDAAKDALQEYEDKLRGIFDPLFGMQDALRGNAEAAADVQAKTLESAAAEKAYLDAVKKHGPKSKEAAAASLEYAAAQQALTEANSTQVRSAEDVEVATAELRAEIESNPAALDKAKAHLKQWQAQGLITAAQAKATAAEFDRLAGSIRKTPSRKLIFVKAVGTDDARLKVIQLRDELGRLHNKTLTIGVTTAIGPQAVGIAEHKLLGFASGGRVPGPKGKPQVILAHGGEEVVPMHDAAAMARYRPLTPGPASIGGVTVINNINVSMAGALVPNAPAAKRWVADAWNEAAANRMVHVRGRPL